MLTVDRSGTLGGKTQAAADAANNERIKFSLIRADHELIDLHPYKFGGERRILYARGVKRQTFDANVRSCHQ